MRYVVAVLSIVLGILSPAGVNAAPSEPSRDINTYVLFAFDELVIKGGTAAADTGHIRGGNIGVNFPGRAVGGFSLAYATTGQATMDPGTQAVADSVRADNPAGVFFDLFANSVNAGFAATILDAGPLPFTTPIIAPANLPTLPFVPGRALTDGASDVTVGGGGVPSPFTFAPGAYRDVRINDHATVTFGDGVFDIRSLSLGVDVTVNVTDNTVLQIDRDLSMNDGLRLGIGTHSGARIFVGALGFNAVTQRVTNFGHDAEIHAQYFAPTGWLDLGGRNELFGHFWAQRITGDPSDNVTHEGGGTPVILQPRPHFQCYEIHRPVMNLSGVSLVDAFGASTVTVQRPKRLCAPADKNGEDPEAPTDPRHLTYYTIDQTSPSVSRVEDVTVTNQFGTLILDVGTPDRMLVPTAKSLLEPPDALAEPIDHFKCYRVSHARFRAAGLHLTDQFGQITVDIKQPLHLCLPASKNGEPVPDPDANLMCYQVRLTPGTPLNQRPPLVFTNNQFGADAFKFFGPRDFCVPSTVTIP